MHDRAEDLHTRIDAVAERFRDDPTVSGTLYRERAIREFIVGDPGACPIWWQRAIECYERAGDLYRACGNRVNFGFAQYRLGAYAEAVAILGVAVVEAERMGLDHLLGMAWHNYGLALCELGAVEEARAVEAKAITFFAAQGNLRFEGVSRGYLARILLRTGALAEAEAEARRAVELLEPAKEDRVQALANLAAVLLASSRWTEALVQAREAMALLTLLDKVQEGEALARVVYAEALDATGDSAAARAAIAAARDRLLAAAARIDDPRWRDSFLRNVPENARTLELARVWLAEDGA
jgi:tetratricopeptide (TPR) repeat protein